MSMTTIDHNAIRQAGLEALTRELGPIGMAYFLSQYDMGRGDYTKERKVYLEGITIDDIKKVIK